LSPGIMGDRSNQRGESTSQIIEYAPCKPANEVEIPRDGHSHCGIFCSPEYAKKHAKEEEIA